MTDWSQKFGEKLEARQQARREARRDYNAYGSLVRTLFDHVEKKVKGISAIGVDRPVMARTDQYGADVQGPIDTIKSLTLKCEGKTIEFTPEGINCPYGKGRVRIRHRSRALQDYLFLYLIVDERSAAPYPSNLVWVFNDGGPDQPPEQFAPFTDERLERLIEAAFLEA